MVESDGATPLMSAEECSPEPLATIPIPQPSSIRSLLMLSSIASSIQAALFQNVAYQKATHSLPTHPSNIPNPQKIP